MKAADIPAKIQLPFANAAGGAYVRTVPVPSQIGIQDGAASFTTGFPPLNFIPIDAGGIPPFGADMNGVLRAISALSRWFASGAPVPFDATFSTAIGGYPKGAIVQSATTFGVMWVSLVDDNLVNPDAGPSDDWASFESVFCPGNPVLLPRAWVCFNGTDGSLRGGYNVSVVNRLNTGRYVVNFSTPMPDINYGALYGAGVIPGGRAPFAYTASEVVGDPVRVNQLYVGCQQAAGEGNYYDAEWITVAIYRS